MQPLADLPTIPHSFHAKSRAPFGSFCQSRLCSSARRLPQTRAVLASARPFRSNPLQGSASLRKLTAPLSAPPSPFMKRMFFSGLPRPRILNDKRSELPMTISRNQPLTIDDIARRAPSALAREASDVLTAYPNATPTSSNGQFMKSPGAQGGAQNGPKYGSILRSTYGGRSRRRLALPGQLGS
jgi:hypothetical protein